VYSRGHRPDCLLASHVHKFAQYYLSWSVTGLHVGLSVEFNQPWNDREQVQGADSASMEGGYSGSAASAEAELADKAHISKNKPPNDSILCATMPSSASMEVSFPIISC
jgi:hypothetical protein